MSSEKLRKLCQLGYGALALLLAGWFIGQGIHGSYSWLFLGLLFIPLLLPLKGIFTGNPYTYAWASFILCLYLIHGLSLFYVSPADRLFASIEVLLISMLLIGLPFYARKRGRELGLGLKKKSKS